MGVYIKGMEMPKNCGDCKAFVCYKQWAGDMGDCFCGITKEDAKAKEKNADCPLVPVPPHGRCIDADALDADLERQDMHTGEWDAVGFSIEEIENAPTIISADPAEEGE